MQFPVGWCNKVPKKSFFMGVWVVTLDKIRTLDNCERNINLLSCDVCVILVSK